jgi:transcriptional regulator with XRE-family HTH domain
MRKKPLEQRDADQLSAMGMAIRDSRRGRLSIEELASRAGISAGQLSHIENGTGNPSVEMLIRIMSVLDLSVGDLFEPGPATQTYVIKAGQRRRYRPLSTGHDLDLLTPGIRFQMSVSRGVIRPGESVTSVLYNGDALFYVLDGQVEIRKTDDTYRLGPGDSLLLSLPHTMTGAGDVPAEYIVIFRPGENP